MEFSELFNGNVCFFSPNGKFLACVCADSVEVRFADSLLKAFKIECSDLVRVIKWSHDSTLLLCQGGRHTLTVFNVVSGSCIATLRQHTCSLSHLSWGPDCRTVAFLEPELCRATIWDMCNEHTQNMVKYIHHIQPWAKQNALFSPNGKHLALVFCGILQDGGSVVADPSDKDTAQNRVDSISIYSSISWRIETSISCVGIQRVGGIVWSSNSYFVVASSCNPLDPVLILCIRSSSIIGKWHPSDLLWPGVCDVQFSPSSQFLAIASKNSKVHILNCVSWSEHLELSHDPLISDPKCQVYQETIGNDFDRPLYKHLELRPVSISFLPKAGNGETFSRVAWSSGGRYLASHLARAPAVVWVWNTANFFQLYCVIVTKHQILDFSWDPVHNTIAIVDGQDCITLWNADNGFLRSVSVCTPISKMLFQANCLHWRNDGRAIVVSSEQNSSLLELTSQDF